MTTEHATPRTVDSAATATTIVALLSALGLAALLVSGHGQAAKPPGAPTITSAPSSPTASQSATFTFAGESGTTFECRLDSGDYTACTSPMTYTGLSFASHTFRVRAVRDVRTSGDAVYSWLVAARPGKPSDPTGSHGPKVGPGGANEPHDPPPAVPPDPSPQDQEPADARNFSVAGSVKGLVPGFWVAIPVTITNPNAETLYVTRLTVRVSGSVRGCDPEANFETRPSTASRVNKLAVPASAEKFAVAPAFRPRIRLKSTGVNQDRCKGRTFSLAFGGSGTSRP